MDLVLKDGIWILNINMIQSLALAVITYYLGVWVNAEPCGGRHDFCGDSFCFAGRGDFNCSL